MMNWNSNDTKYIIKRIILYFIIAGIVFFAGQSCAKARIETRYWCSNGSSTTPCDTVFAQSEMTKYPPLYYVNNNNPYFQNYEQGYLLFSLVAFYGSAAGTQQYVGIYSATVRTYGGTGAYGVYTCDIGNIGGYKDNTTQYEIYSVKCPVQTTSNWYLYDLALTKYGQTEMYVRRSETITFVSEVSDANAIVSAQQTAAQQQIDSINNMSSSMQAALGTHASNIINATQTASQQQIAAINNQTQAINNQTEWFEEQHDPLIDTGFLDVMGDLITTNDSDVVRQFILIPFNLFVQIYNACTSNTW